MLAVSHATASASGEPVCCSKSGRTRKEGRHGRNLPLSGFGLSDTAPPEVGRTVAPGAHRAHERPHRSGYHQATRGLYCPGARFLALLRSTEDDDRNHKSEARCQNSREKEWGGEDLGHDKGVGEHRERRQEDEERQDKEEDVHRDPSIPHRPGRVVASKRGADRLRAIRITGWTALSLLLATLAFFAAWGATPHTTDRDVLIDVYARDDLVVTTADNLLVLRPADGDGALHGQAMVFWPGARVDPHAYAGRFADFVTDTGMTIVIPRPVLNFALLDPRGPADFETVAAPATVTAVGGHSMGGVKACQGAAETGGLSLVLFAAYCAENISGTGIQALSVVGSNDLLLSAEDIDTGVSRLPGDATVLTVEGANHALFGDYGPQYGDGVAQISPAALGAELTRALERFFLG